MQVRFVVECTYREYYDILSFLIDSGCVEYGYDNIKTFKIKDLMNHIEKTVVYLANQSMKPALETTHTIQRGPICVSLTEYHTRMLVRRFPIIKYV